MAPRRGWRDGQRGRMSRRHDFDTPADVRVPRLARGARPLRVRRGALRPDRQRRLRQLRRRAPLRPEDERRSATSPPTRARRSAPATSTRWASSTRSSTTSSSCTGANAIPDAMPAALERTRRTQLGDRRRSTQTLAPFAEHFPTIAAYRGDTSATRLPGRPDRTACPTARSCSRRCSCSGWRTATRLRAARELFDDAPLDDRQLPTRHVIAGLRRWFKTQPGFGPEDEDLITLLRRPALEAAPTRCRAAALDRERWGFVAERFGDRLVISLDVLTEEERAVWMRFNATQGGADDAVARRRGYGRGRAARLRLRRRRRRIPRSSASAPTSTGCRASC